MAIDADGHIDGEAFAGLKGLRQRLLQNQDQLARSVYESLLSYGIGREIEFVDEDDIAESLAAMKTKNYLMLCAVIAVVWSSTLLFVPTVSDAVEQQMISFLSTHAR